MTIAALYVDDRGPYIDMPGVDAWTIDRDARLYDGPNPVVSHPPCADWCMLSHQHPDQPDRMACGPRAVEQVRAWGGVLEHPAFSKLWHHCDLPRPGEFTDEFGGWTLSVDQVSWGHLARKRTWLYIVGVHPSDVTPRRGGTPTHILTTVKRMGPTLPEMRKVDRKITPPLFAAWLVAIARNSRGCTHGGSART